MVRPIVEKRIGLILVPDQVHDARTNKPSLGRGVVVMHGPPALAKDGMTEVAPGFQVGDEVLYLGQHHSRRIPWEDGEVAMVAQEEIAAVIERGDPVPTVTREA
jgi:co-chaperonin GroES (HSP10)